MCVYVCLWVCESDYPYIGQHHDVHNTLTPYLVGHGQDLLGLLGLGVVPEGKGVLVRGTPCPPLAAAAHG